MNRYDPDHAPDSEQWLALDEQERIRLVEENHRALRIRHPNLKAHAIFHAIVENQIAENVASVVRAMVRLRTEGLSRHDALHAIASVTAEHIHDLPNSGTTDKGSSQAIYDAAVERLTAERWRDG